MRNPKIDFVWTRLSKTSRESTGVDALNLMNVRTGAETKLPVQGVFVYIGHFPNTELFQGQLDMDEEGYLKVDERLHTKIPGVFAEVRRTIIFSSKRSFQPATAVWRRWKWKNFLQCSNTKATRQSPPMGKIQNIRPDDSILRRAGESGAPLVFIHGAGDSHLLWNEQLAALSPMLRGHMHWICPDTVVMRRRSFDDLRVCRCRPRIPGCVRSGTRHFCEERRWVAPSLKCSRSNSPSG